MGAPRTDEDRIDTPQTADDFLLAAKAWATGHRSHCNYWAGEVDGYYAADAAKATALASVATAMFTKAATR